MRILWFLYNYLISKIWQPWCDAAIVSQQIERSLIHFENKYNRRQLHSASFTNLPFPNQIYSADGASGAFHFFHRFFAGKTFQTPDNSINYRKQVSTPWKLNRTWTNLRLALCLNRIWNCTVVGRAVYMWRILCRIHNGGIFFYIHYIRWRRRKFHFGTFLILKLYNFFAQETCQPLTT